MIASAIPYNRQTEFEKNFTTLLQASVKLNEYLKARFFLSVRRGIVKQNRRVFDGSKRRMRSAEKSFVDRHYTYPMCVAYCLSCDKKCKILEYACVLTFTLYINVIGIHCKK